MTTPPDRDNHHAALSEPLRARRAPVSDELKFAADEAGGLTRYWPALVIAVIFFLAVAPLLKWLQFTNGGEVGVVLAAQELRRGQGTWLVPTLFGEQRTKKPPLATWLAALPVRHDTVRQLDSEDQAVRDAAYRDLSWQMRWPSLLSACALLLAIYGMGETFGGVRLGVVSAAIAGSSVMWLEQSRLATTDVQLALWVAVANFCLARLLFRGQWWMGCIGAATALGLAMLSKGPPSLLQSLVPTLVFVAWNWAVEKNSTGYQAVRTPHAGRLAPIIIGAVILPALGFGWFVLVWLKNPDVLREWWVEVTRRGATEGAPDPWFNYLLIFPLLFPWCVFFVLGLVRGATCLFSKTNLPGRATIRRQFVFCWLLIVVPILVMSFFRDRKDRYLLPMLAPAAVMTGMALLEFLDASRRENKLGLAALHWTLVAIVGAMIVLGGSRIIPHFRTLEGHAVIGVAPALLGASVVVLAAAAGWWLSRRAWQPGGEAAMVGPTVAIMLFCNVVAVWAMRPGAEGLSEMKPLADAIRLQYPRAEIYSFRPSRPTRHAPLDLSIYLNRVVRNLPTADALAGTAGARLYLEHQRFGDPTPAGPAGWREVSATRRDKSIWHVFASPEADAARGASR